MLDLIEEHLEELDFLWEQRESVIFAPDWSRADLAELEERAEAHLDGLRLAEGHAVDLARPLLSGEERGAATAATFVLMAMNDRDLEQEVAAALAGKAPASDGVRVGLRHCPLGGLAGRLVELAVSGDPESRARACDVLAFHRAPAPPRFAELLDAEDPGLRLLAFGSAGRFGGPWDLRRLEETLGKAGASLQRAAFETSARLGTKGLAQGLRAAAKGRVPEALACLGVLGDRADLPLLRAALDDAALANAALAGLGALGDPQAVPSILARMGSAGTAIAAGAAFVRITGATGIEAAEPLPPPEDMPDEEKEFWEAPRPPDPERARAFWAGNEARFAAAARWQGGVDVSAAPPKPEILDLLPLEARRDVYLAARAQDPRFAPDLEIEARVRAASAVPVSRS